jgi:hypothetical protein
MLQALSREVQAWHSSTNPSTYCATTIQLLQDLHCQLLGKTSLKVMCQDVQEEV